MSTRSPGPVSSMRRTTGVVTPHFSLRRTARAQASPTASLTPSIRSSPNPTRRATADATSRAVRTCPATGGKRSSTRPIGGSGSSARRFERVGERGVDREHLGEPGDAEDLEDLLLVADQAERAIVRPGALEAADEDAEAGGVQEVDAGHVHDEVVVAVGDELVQPFPQVGRGVDVDLA